MLPTYNIAVDASLLVGPAERETVLYATELLAGLEKERPGWQLTYFSDAAASFQSSRPFNEFVATSFDACLILDYQQNRFGIANNMPKIIFIDHLAPLGLKEKIFDTWALDRQTRYRASLNFYTSPTLVLTSSDWMKRDVIIWSGYTPHNVSPLGGGVPSDFVELVPTTRQETLHALKIAGRYLMSWLDDELFSGFELTFAAFIENKKTFSDCCLLVCYRENFEMLAKVKAWCAENNRSDIIFYQTTDRELIRELLADAVCLSHPQEYDGFSLKILSAMSQACPVITTRSSSLPEVGADTALYTNVGDASELAQQMHRLLQDEGLRSSLKNQTLLRSERFRWRDVALRAAEAIEQWLPTANVPVFAKGDLG